MASFSSSDSDPSFFTFDLLPTEIELHLWVLLKSGGSVAIDQDQVAEGLPARRAPPVTAIEDHQDALGASLDQRAHEPASALARSQCRSGTKPRKHFSPDDVVPSAMTNGASAKKVLVSSTRTSTSSSERSRLLAAP